jgi:hypothetical protein
MRSTSQAAQLGRMLDLCEDLQRIRMRIADPETRVEERTRLRQKSERRSGRLTRELASYKSRGPLARLLRAHKLDAREFEVLAVLLQRAVRAEDPDMQGRLILAQVFETSFGVLSGMHLLAEDARLRTSGLVRLSDDHPPGTNVMDSNFRLSEEAMSALRGEVGATSPRRRRQTKKPEEGYGNQRELLLELRILVNHYRRRSEMIFEAGRWDGLFHCTHTTIALSRQIDQLWSGIHQRLLITEQSAKLPLVALRREFGLDEGETVILVYMLFRELFAGEAFADVADLLKLISASETDLLRARHYFSKDAPLLRHQLINLEPFVENRELTAEARLNDWVVNRLLEDGAPKSEIAPDERLRWHQYLDGLDDSGGFFRSLES